MGTGLKTNIADSQFRMNLINNSLIPLNEIMSQNDADLKAIIGNASNTGGTATAGTIMAKLNAIITNVASVINYVKTNNAANASGTLSQKLSYLENQVSTLQTNLSSQGVAQTNLSDEIAALQTSLNNKSTGGFTVQRGEIEIYFSDSMYESDNKCYHKYITIDPINVNRSFLLVNRLEDRVACSHNTDGYLGYGYRIVNSTTIDIFSDLSDAYSHFTWQVITGS